MISHCVHFWPEQPTPEQSMNASFPSLSTQTIRNRGKDGEHVTHSRGDVMGIGGGEGGCG